jgi:DNA adenine methylase
MAVKPFIKWAGGKRQLIDQLSPMFPAEITKYYEPFLGGGAVFFEIKPSVAYLNDLNSELITTYKVVKTNVEELIEELKSYPVNKEFFYEIRSWDRNKEEYQNLSDIKKASRFIYLNKTCFNGIYRVNSKNEFNVPYADYKHPDIVDEKTLRDVSSFLNSVKAEFTSLDFRDVLKNVQRDSFVYLDPPYEPVSPTESFTTYTKDGFIREDQIELKECCDELNKRGVLFMLSNSSSPFIIDLYKDYDINYVSAKRAINSKGDKRGAVKEIVVKNY